MLRLVDLDISVNVALSALRSFSSLSCGNVSVVQLTGKSGRQGVRPMEDAGIRIALICTPAIVAAMRRDWRQIGSRAAWGS